MCYRVYRSFETLLSPLMQKIVKYSPEEDLKMFANQQLPNQCSCHLILVLMLTCIY